MSEKKMTGFYRLVEISGPYSFRPAHGTTNIWCRVIDTPRGLKFELRMGWEFPGDRRYSETENPFDEEFVDNYVRVVAYRLRVAWNLLSLEMSKIANSYWI